MADSNRLTVDELILHHSVTELWSEKSKPELAQWFSDNGFARGYGSNPNNWSGLVNPYTGARSYAQAQYAGQRVDGTTPDASHAEKASGYRLVPLVQDVWGQICWHAGNWNANQRSIGIENLGDYRNYTLRDGDCLVIADFWRPQDQKLGGNTAVYGHSEVSDVATACPARIMEKRDLILEYINNPPVTAPTWTSITPVKMRAKADLQPIDVVTKAPVGGVIKGATEIDFASSTRWNNTDYFRTVYATSKNTNTGIRADQVAPIVVPPTPTPVPTPTPIPPAPTKDDEQDQRLNALEKTVKYIVDFLTNLFKGFKP